MKTGQLIVLTIPGGGAPPRIAAFSGSNMSFVGSVLPLIRLVIFLFIKKGNVLFQPMKEKMKWKIQW